MHEIAVVKAKSAVSCNLKTGKLMYMRKGFMWNCDVRTGFAAVSRSPFWILILKLCVIVCIYRRHALQWQSLKAGLLSLLTYLGKDGIDLGHKSFPLQPWLIALDNFVCWCGRILSFRLVEFSLLNWKLQANKETKWHSKTYVALKIIVEATNISVFFFKFRRPAVFEIVLPVILIGVLILPK